jgi:hypothetical protein
MEGKGRGVFERHFLNNQPGIRSWCHLTFSEQLDLPVSVWRFYFRRAMALSEQVKEAHGKQVPKV